MAKRINPLEGSLWDKILAFALPLAATSIIQQLFNSCDVATVGQFSGSHSLAAVGSTAPITNLFITIFVGFSVGANVIISRFLGAQREDRANQANYKALYHTYSTCIIYYYWFYCIYYWRNHCPSTTRTYVHTNRSTTSCSTLLKSMFYRNVLLNYL